LTFDKPPATLVHTFASNQANANQPHIGIKDNAIIAPFSHTKSEAPCQKPSKS